MIIQKVIKGIPISTEKEVSEIFDRGICCNWWIVWCSGKLPVHEVPQRLTDELLDWHQNRYGDPYPGTSRSDRPFYEQTPFISTTAGTIERNTFYQTNIRHSARDVALPFATEDWTRDACLFFCYLFILGKKSVGHEHFSEELRELNIYSGYSAFQPEGEITAKIIIPPPQIERAELWSLKKVQMRSGLYSVPTLTNTWDNPLYLPPEDYHNIREILD